ncbi:MAG: alpha/beta hydrolase [Candidatus Thiodiazotropha sp. (ex Semelilucina semeliformis)]|nr:alpha/beta hydrolase [Candidatus Thiodiazotropha sp. (ex Semelilucina semeliformis)]
MSESGNRVSSKSNPFSNHQLPLGIRLFLYSAGVMFSVIGSVSPRLAGKIALRFFMTPPSYPVPRRESAVCDSAKLEIHEINGEKIAVRSWGEGPSVLLCHGWGGRGTQFFALIEGLVAAGYRAVAFDAPAHGDSSGSRTNMLEVTRTIASVAEREGPITAVIGHSFGCGTALLAIDRYDLPSDKVVLFSCFTDTLWITEQFAEAFSISNSVINAMRDEAMRRFVHHFETPWEWSQLSPVNTIKQVEGDLLLIHDKQDLEVPYKHAEKLMEIAPKAELLTTDRLGHKKILMNKQCIEACIEHIRRG